MNGYLHAISKAQKLGYNVYDTNYLNGYYKKYGKGPELDSNGVFTNPWAYKNQSPINFSISSPVAYPASDEGIFDDEGIEYIMKSNIRNSIKRINDELEEAAIEFHMLFINENDKVL